MAESVERGRLYTDGIVREINNVLDGYPELLAIGSISLCDYDEGELLGQLGSSRSVSITLDGAGQIKEVEVYETKPSDNNTVHTWTMNECDPPYLSLESNGSYPITAKYGELIIGLLRALSTDPLDTTVSIDEMMPGIQRADQSSRNTTARYDLEERMAAARLARAKLQKRYRGADAKTEDAGFISD